MMFSKSKYKVLHMSHSTPCYPYKLGDGRIEHSPTEKHLGDWYMAGWHEQAVWPCSPESQPYPGLQQKQHGQQVKGGDPATLHCSGETSPGVLHPDLESSVQERHRPVGGGPQK